MAEGWSFGRRWKQDSSFRANTKVAIVSATIFFLLGILVTHIYYNASAKDTNKILKNTDSIAADRLWEMYGMTKEQLLIYNSSSISTTQLDYISKHLDNYAYSGFSQAVLALYANDFTSSLNHINDAIILYPDNSEYILFKGYVYYALGNYSATLEYITLDRLKIYNKDFLWYAYIGALSNSNRSKEAITAYDQYYKICDSPDICNKISMGKAFEYLMQDNLTEARMSLENVNMSYINNSQYLRPWVYYQVRGSIELKEGRYGESIESFQEGMRLIQEEGITDFNKLTSFKEMGNLICDIKLELNQLTNLGFIEICEVKSRNGNETIFLSQYDRERNMFQTTTSIQSYT